MEPADPAQLSHKLGQQDTILESQQQQLLAVMQYVQTMTHKMAALSTAVQAAQTIPRLGHPRLLLLWTLGQPSIHQPLLRRSAKLVYHHSRGTIDPPRMLELSYPVSAHFQPPAPDLSHRRGKSGLYHHLTDGQGQEVGNRCLGGPPTVRPELTKFMQEMHQVFDRSNMGMDAGRELMQLRQGSSSVSDYAIEFQNVVTDSGWEGRAVIDAFLHGLAKPIKDELLTQDLLEELDWIITLAIRIDTRLEDRRWLVKL